MTGAIKHYGLMAVFFTVSAAATALTALYAPEPISTYLAPVPFAAGISIGLWYEIAWQRWVKDGSPMAES